MSAFSIFKVSFDGALVPWHRRKGRFAAIIFVSGGGAFVLVSFLTILHVNSNQLADMANAAAPRDVRATSDQSPDKACADQSWPFMQGRCLIDTKSLRQAERVLPRQAVAKRATESPDGVLLPRKKRARKKSPDGILIATRAKPTQTTASLIGAAPRNESTSQPAPKPATAVANTPAAPSTTATVAAANPTPPKTNNKVAARRKQEQPKREAHRKPLTREQREARAEMRSRQYEMRSASRWGDYGYQHPNGGGWQRSFDGGFFSTIR